MFLQCRGQNQHICGDWEGEIGNKYCFVYVAFLFWERNADDYHVPVWRVISFYLPVGFAVRSSAAS